MEASPPGSSRTSRREANWLPVGVNLYENLYWTPLHALEGGVCDEKSRRVTLTAVLRTLGVPARLRPLDGAPEVWRDGAFYPIRPQETGSLRLSGTDQPWSLSRWQDGGWRLLHPEAGAETLVLPAGRYRLITSVRLPNGNLSSQTPPSRA